MQSMGENNTDQPKDRIFLLRTYDFIQQNYQKPNEKITDVQLECEGYGLFQPATALLNFFSCFQKIVQIVKNSKKHVVKSLKITLNGFKMGKNSKYLINLTHHIKQISQNIKTLWVHTTDLEEVTIQDFDALFHLMFGMGSNTQNANFEDFSLQCANWTFTPRQPNFNELMNVFKGKLTDYFDQSGQLNALPNFLHQKHVRIQISGWYYTAIEAKAFLGFRPSKQEFDKLPQAEKVKYDDCSQELQKNSFERQIERFHFQMAQLISKLLEIMAGIQQLQVDMRNTHEFLKTSNLKNRLVTNVTKYDRYEKSLISMRQTQTMHQGQNNKQFRLNVMM